jgi:hypothetical protein
MIAPPIGCMPMDFQVKRDDLNECRFVEAAAPELESGQSLLAVRAFGLTSNNITYAVLGEAMSYWEFFPAEGGWGHVPVWGFADVVESEHQGLETGVRVFGYLPPSTHLVVTPDRVDARGFVDAAPHRSKLPGAYNSYFRADADPCYEERYEAQQMLLWPLFFTSFLLDDYLDDESFFGAGAVVISSASSRTASSAAFLIAGREAVDVIGLTSPRNVAFVERLGVYDRVVPYGEVASLPREPAVYLDVAGDAEVRAAVHRHYGEALAHDAAVGATHRDRMTTGPGELPGPAPAFFFAPDRVRKRAEDWGRERLNTRLAEAWRPYVEWTSGWLEVVHGSGPEAVERAYRELLDGRTDPAVGHILSPAS